MDTNNMTAAEDAEMVDCDGEKVVTMMDVLREQEDFENDANAVLGASDEKNCTYAKGYIKRQAIYACMTCCAEAKDDPTKRAGVCLACSLTCHENHDHIELYTKRNFRCDCGNPKFNSKPCQYTATKTDINENNEYNQNFSGLYCVCNRPYPDPEIKDEEEMIQCIICEDWLHATHLEAILPPNDQYSEMICKSCMEKNSFLHDYSEFAVNIENDVDVVSGNTENTISNAEPINDQIQLSEDNYAVDVTQQMPDKLEKKNNANIGNVQENPDISLNNKLENTLNDSINNDSNVLVKDANDGNIIPSDSIHKETEQDINLEGTKDVQEFASVSKTSLNIDAESIDEDKLLADPEEDIAEEPSIQKTSVPEDNKINDASETQNNELMSDTNTNKGDEICEDTKADTNTEIKAYENESKSDKANSNLETKDVILEDVSLDKVNVENIEPNEPDNKTESKQSSEEEAEIEQLPETVDNDQNNCLETTTNETAEDKIVEAPIADNIEDNKESNESEAQNVKDSATPNTKNNDDKEENSDVEMKTDNHIETEVRNEYVNDFDDKTSENKRKLSSEDNLNKDEEEIGGKRVKLDCTCIRPKNIKRVYKGATFWPSDFRQKLCTCNECLTMYKDLSVLFLTDLEDTVRAYENLGEEKERIEGKPVSQYEKGLQALSSLDRIQQINALTEYNKLKDKLLEFLKSFKDRKEVVKEEDIKEFFAGMKPKREPDGVYFCR